MLSLQYLSRPGHSARAACFPRIHAPALLLEPLRNPCRRAARRPGTSAVRPLARAARNRPERGRAPPARARHRGAPGYLRECQFWLPRAMAVGANRRRDRGAEAFAVRAGPARLALLPAAGRSGRSFAVECLAASAYVSRCGGCVDALRAGASCGHRARPLSDLSPGMAAAMAEGRFDLRERRRGRHRPASRRRKRVGARRRALASCTVARRARRSGRRRANARGRSAAGLSLSRGNRHARSGSHLERAVAGSGQRIRAAHHAAVARRAIASAFALGRRAAVCVEPVPRVLVRRGQRGPRRSARRRRPTRLSAGGSSVTGRMGPSDSGATAHAA